MKGLIALGIALLLVGAALMIKGSFSWNKKHENQFLGMKVQIEDTEETKIPIAVSGTFLALGAALVLVGALKKK